MHFINHNGLIINERFFELLKAHGLDSFECLLNYEGGSVFNKKKTHSVVRIELGEGEGFYLKRHFWSAGERVKALFARDRPEEGRNEWEGILLLEELGFPTMVAVAFGEERSFFGLPSVSLTLTEEIYGAERVEDYIPSLTGRVIEKRELVRRLGLLARDFHRKGLCHQDFYLGHFFINPETGELFLVDLQRVHKRKAVRKTDRIKDLAQLTFSARNTENFTWTDLVRFAHTYLGKEKFDNSDKRMIRRIFKKSEKIARHTEKLLRARQSGKHVL
jgi:heptose I phosphotransferase